MSRVSVDDLGFASEWMASYDAGPDDAENAARRDRVVAWLDAEVAKRQRAMVVSAAARKLGVKPSVLRGAIARKAARAKAGTP